MSETNDICVIFDLDGTLVDSETLCNQAFLDLLPELADPVEALVARYRGRKLAAVFADIEKRLGRALPAAFEKTYRSRVSELFAAELEPMPGVEEMLESFDHPKCIASSGPPAKIRQALEVSGLERFFGDRFFSSYDVGIWKPDPGLFLHAAQAMNRKPDRCIVVEDSEVGIQAALAAEMAAIHYLPQNDLSGIEGVTEIHDMRQLPEFIARIAGRSA
jgi:HAD superfamily hydrolase (TIGR01509 family)